MEQKNTQLKALLLKYRNAVVIRNKQLIIAFRAMQQIKIAEEVRRAFIFIQFKNHNFIQQRYGDMEKYKHKMQKQIEDIKGESGFGAETI